MKIPFGTIHITDRAKELVNQCLESGRVSCGRLVAQFEERFAALIGAGEGVAVSSGTDALAVGLSVLYDRGASRGDEVIVPALTFVATANAVLHAGFKPVFADVDPLTLNIDPAKAEAVITGRTRAILAVHLMGKPADMDALEDIAARHGLPIIEDAAEAHGGEHRGRRLGSIGLVGCFSLYVAHIISTGEGGIITTSDARAAELCRSLRAHGRACACKTCVSNLTSGYCAKRFEGKDGSDIRFSFQRVGFSSKMNELEAALGLGGLDEFEAILAARRANLAAMREGYKEFDRYFSTVPELEHERIGPHAFPFVRRPGAPFTRDQFLAHLEKNGVDARTLFSSIPTQCGGYEFLGHSPGDFPAAEYVGLNGLHIGVHQDVKPEHVEHFLNVTRAFVAGLPAKAAG